VLSQFPLFQIEENLCKSGPRAATDAKQRPGFQSADNNFSAFSVFSAVSKPCKIPGLTFAPPGWQKSSPQMRPAHAHKCPPQKSIP